MGPAPPDYEHTCVLVQVLGGTQSELVQQLEIGMQPVPQALNPTLHAKAQVRVLALQTPTAFGGAMQSALVQQLEIGMQLPPHTLNPTLHV